MTGSTTFDQESQSARSSARPQWPKVVGTIGIVLGALILLDQLDNLAVVSWTEDDWGRIFAPDIAELIVRSVPSTGWLLLTSMVQMGLGVLLMVGSLALRKRALPGIYMCRFWAWLAIAWSVFIMGRATWWLLQNAGELLGVPLARWQAYGMLGIGLALVLLLAFPVFLLVWFSKHEVRSEYETWSS